MVRKDIPIKITNPSNQIIVVTREETRDGVLITLDFLPQHATAQSQLQEDQSQIFLYPDHISRRVASRMLRSLRSWFLTLFRLRNGSGILFLM